MRCSLVFVGDRLLLMPLSVMNIARRRPTQVVPERHRIDLVSGYAAFAYSVAGNERGSPLTRPTPEGAVMPRLDESVGRVSGDYHDASRAIAANLRGPTRPTPLQRRVHYQGGRLTLG